MITCALCLFCFLSSSLSASESTQTLRGPSGLIGGKKPYELMQYLITHPEGSLDSFLDGRIGPREAELVGGNTAYYIGVHMELSNMLKEAKEMYGEAVEEADSHVRPYAESAYLSLLVKNGEYAEAISLGLRLVEKRGKAFPPHLAAPLIRALFAAGRYEELVRLAEEYESNISSSAWNGSVKGDVEAELEAMTAFLPVWARWFKDMEGWERELARYLKMFSYEDIPEPVYTWLGFPSDFREEKERQEYIGERLDYAEVSEGFAAFFRAKALLAGGRYDKAFRAYVDYLSSLVSGGEDKLFLRRCFTSHPGDEFVKTALYSGHIYTALEQVESTRSTIENEGTLAEEKFSRFTEGESSTGGEGGAGLAEGREVLFWFLETEAYFNRRLGRFDKSERLYSRALDRAPDSERERMRWYRFDSLVRNSPSRAVEELLTLSNEWGQPDYYNDVLFDLADRLVQQRRWAEIARTADILARKSRTIAAARFAYIAGRAGELGFYETEEEHIRFWYNHAERSGYGTGAANYYRIMAEERLEMLDGGGNENGREWPFNGVSPRFAAEKPVFAAEKSPAEVSESSGEMTVKLIAGYLRYGLCRYAYQRYGDDGEVLSSLPRFVVRLWAQHLQSRTRYLESVRLLSTYYEETGKRIEDDDVRLLYPKAYDEIIEKISNRYNLPVYVFYALVREESLFSADISSSAGAIGLTQLMPSTAEDVASRMGIRIHDLTDPSINLNLGGWYLDHLIGRTDSYSRALFSYNGGITRVRRWVRRNEDLPGDLLLEAIPYKETSHYGRKVLVSAVVYGYIYYEVDIERIVETFFITNNETKEQL